MAQCEHPPIRVGTIDHVDVDTIKTLASPATSQCRHPPIRDEPALGTLPTIVHMNADTGHPPIRDGLADHRDHIDVDTRLLLAKIHLNADTHS